MTIYDLIKIDNEIRATIAVINAEGHRLYGKSSELTQEGKRKEWERITAKYPAQIDAITAKIDAIALAVDKVEPHERDALLRPVGSGLTAAQELAIARLLARPGAYEMEKFAATIGPHLETTTATVMVEEIQAHNPQVDDNFVSAVLAQESRFYKEALESANHVSVALGVLRQGLTELTKALDFSTVNGSDLHNPHRAGVFLTPLDSMFNSLKIADTGNVHI